MQDVKPPDGNSMTVPVQSSAPDATTPDTALPVTNPPALIPQPRPPSGNPVARSRLRLWLPSKELCHDVLVAEVTPQRTGDKNYDAVRITRTATPRGLSSLPGQFRNLSQPIKPPVAVERPSALDSRIALIAGAGRADVDFSSII